MTTNERRRTTSVYTGIYSVQKLSGRNMIVPTLSVPIYMRDKNVLSHNIELQVSIINIIRYT